MERPENNIIENDLISVNMMIFFRSSRGRNRTEKGPFRTEFGPVQPENRPETDHGEGGDILCASCGAPVTSRDRKTDRGGAFSHGFFNPAGLVFVIGCFTDCPGCAVIGPHTTEFTWFPGYAWQVAVCRACLTHLGWRYASSLGDGFFGLILDRLVEG